MNEYHPESPVKSRFAVWSMQELLEMEFPAVGWIIEKLIPTPGLTFIAGKAGKGKSLITLAVAKAVSYGVDFAGHFETKQGGVMIIDEENQPSEVQKRINLFQIDKGSPIYLMSMQGFQVTNNQHIQAVLKLATEKECKVLIIDSLVRTHSLDENQAKEMRQVRKALSPIISAGVAVIIIHHQGKLGADQKEAGMRGSSELDAMAESVLMVSKMNRTITITQTKSRLSEAVPAFEIELLGDGVENLELVYKGLDSANKENRAKQAIIELLSGVGSPMNQSDVCSKISESHELSAHMVRTALSSLVKSKDIVSKKGERSALLYSLWHEEEK